MMSRPRRTSLLALAGLIALAFGQRASAQALTRLQQFEGPVNYAIAQSSMRTGDNNNPCAIATSTSATISGIPAGSTVLGAYLYWTGSGNPDNTVTFAGAATSAGATWTRVYNTTFNYFGARATVTGRIASPGNGTYTLTDLTVNNGTPFCASQAVLKGWALVVVYQNNTLPLRRVEVWDGFDLLMNGSSTVTVTDFVASTTQASKLSVLTWEGDPTITGGEAVSFNGTTLPFAPAGNVFNSTDGYGADLLEADITSLLTGFAQSGTVGYTTGGDLVLVHAVAVALSITSVYVTPQTGSVDRLPGTSYSQTFNVRNTSLLDDAFDLVPSLTGPAGVVRIDSIVGSGFPSGSWTGGTVRVSIPQRTSQDYTVWYTVLPGTPATNRIHFLARSVAYASVPEGTSEGYLDVNRILQPDLVPTKTAPATFTQGSNGTYTVTVRNSGNAASSGTVTVRDNLPTGLTYVSGASIRGTWAFSVAGQVVTATSAGAIAIGDSAKLTITAAVGAAAVPSVTNVAVVSGGGEVVTANDTARVTTTVLGLPNLNIAKTATGPFDYGETNPYTIAISNTGTGATTSAIVVTDTLPAALTLVSGAGAGWAFDSATIASGRQVVTATYSGAPLPAATGTTTITLNVRVLSTAASVINTAWVSGGGDATPASASTPAITVTDRPDLAITKTEPATFTQGTAGTYTVTVTNTGQARTGTITITVLDTLPAGMTYNSRTLGNFDAVNVANGVVTATHNGRIAVGQSLSFTVTVTPQLAAVPSVTNRAIVSAPAGTEYNFANDTATVTTPVIGLVDLLVAKTAPASFTQGVNGAYTLTVRNAGIGASSGPITVRDSLPAGLTYVSAASVRGAWTFGAVGQIVTATYAASLAVNDSARFSLTVSPGTAALPSVTNAAVVAGGGEWDLANDTARVTTTVLGVPDLTVAKTAAGTFTQGVNGTYTLTARNVGSAASAGAITVRDSLPAGLAYVSAAGVRGAWTFANVGKVVTATHAASLAASDSAKFTLTVAVAPAAVPSVTNTAVVAGGGQSNVANDTARVTTSVLGLPNLAIAKTAAGSFTSGVNGSYTITMRNVGTAASTGAIAVRDSLPVGLGYVSAAAVRGSWTFANAGQVVTATYAAALAVGDSAKFTLTVTVGAAAVPAVTNVAVVAGGGESDLADDTARVTTSAQGVPDLTLSKLAGGAFRIGSNASYALTVTNSGDGATTADIVVRDTLPAGLTFVSGSGAGWAIACLGQVVTATYSGAALAPAANAPFALTVAVGTSAAPSVVNRAWVSGGGETNTANDGTGDVTTAVGGIPGIAVAISVSPGGAIPPGSELTYNITFLNGGTADAVNVVVTDAVPPEVEFKVGSVITSTPAGVTATVEYFSAGSWSYLPVTGGCGAGAGYDACVTSVRWVLQNPLAPAATGNAWLTARTK